MTKLFALAVLVAALPVAHAQDKGKSEFTPSAEYRPRYFFMQNQAGTTGNDSFAEHRFKLGLNYKANEKLSGHMTLLHAMDFGTADNTNAAGSTNAADANNSFDNKNQENMLNVNEAYMNWMVSDDFSLRVGRMNFQIADGAVIGYNDWEQNPGAFDGLTGTWEAEFGRFTGFAFNLRENIGTAAPKDSKHSMYGLSFDLKTMPDFMKMVNVHVIKNNADAAQPSTTTGRVETDIAGQDLLRYGAGVGFDFGMIDLKAHYEMNTGKYKPQPKTATSELDAQQMMYQAELGLKLDAFMGSRLYALYHVDSGDANGTDGKNETYDSFFYERHGSAGLMDLFAWGNLTKMTVGWTMKPGDSTDAGISYNMFKKTEAKGGVVNGRFGGALGAGTGTGDKLGDEIDLWAEHRYAGGLSTLFRVGYFMPGDVYKGPVTKQDEGIMHVALEGKLTF